jgi:hypothetical protein
MSVLIGVESHLDQIVSDPRRSGKSNPVFEWLLVVVRQIADG